MNAPPRPLRFLFIGFAGLSLLSGVWIGIARLGVALPLPNPAMIALHGPLMTIGFLLTLIGLERAAAVDRWWVYGIPLLSVVSIAASILGLPQKLFSPSSRPHCSCCFSIIFFASGEKNISSS